MQLRNILIFLFAVFGFVTFLLAIITWRKRSTAGQPAVFLALCMLGISIYNVGYSFEIGNNTLSGKMAWVRFEHVGILMVIPTWLLIAFFFTGRVKSISPQLIMGISIVPMITFFTAQTLGWLNLFHHNPRLDTDWLFPTFIYDRSFFSYLFLVYCVLFILVATVFYMIRLIDTAAPFRRQTILYLTASMLPWFAGILYNLGLMPHNLDFIPFALSVSAILFGIGFLRLQLLDIVPLARDVIFEGMGDGVLVLDLHDQIIDLNPGLTSLLPDITKASIGHTVFEELADYPALLGQIRSNTPSVIDLEVKTGETASYYRSWGKPSCCTISHR